MLGQFEKQTSSHVGKQRKISLDPEVLSQSAEKRGHRSSEATRRSARQQCTERRRDVRCRYLFESWQVLLTYVLNRSKDKRTIIVYVWQCWRDRYVFVRIRLLLLLSLFSLLLANRFVWRWDVEREKEKGWRTTSIIECRLMWRTQFLSVVLLISK